MAYLITVSTLVLLFTLLGLSLNWLLGYGGMFSVAHGALLGVGAYSTAIFETRFGVTPILAVLIAIVVTTVCGTALGYTAVRVSGEFLIIASFGLQEVASSVFVNAHGLTGGSSGIVMPSPLSVPGLDPSNSALLVIGVLTVGAIALSMYMSRRNRLRVGLVVRALREDEIALAACGHSVRGVKLVVHAVSFAAVGLAGGLYAHMLQFVAPDDFSLDTSILVLTVVAIGGAANSLGPLIGALVAVGLPELLTFTPLPTTQAVPMQQLFYGVVLVLFMLFRRNGLLNPDYRATRSESYPTNVDGTGDGSDAPVADAPPQTAQLRKR